MNNIRRRPVKGRLLETSTEWIGGRDLVPGLKPRRRALDACEWSIWWDQLKDRAGPSGILNPVLWQQEDLPFPFVARPESKYRYASASAPAAATIMLTLEVETLINPHQTLPL